jgi:hypothetical protein
MECGTGSVTDQQERQSLLLPISYWPERSATHWWDDFRREEVVRDFNLAYAAGASLLHLTVPWNVSQPHSDRVSVTFMRDLETVLRVASDTGIRCLLSIAVASVFDVLTLPNWFYELTADDRARPIRAMRRLYDDPVVVGATRRIVDELTGEFGGHPNSDGWIIGDGLLSASPPSSAEHVDAWLDRMRSSIHLPGGSTWHGVSARDIASQGALRLHSLGLSGFGGLVHVDWKPPWAHDTHLWTTFLVSYVRGLGGLPPLVAGTARYPVPASAASEDRVDGLIGELRDAGAAGLIWPALFDYDPRLRGRQPFSSAPGELARGLLPTGDEMSQAAIAWLDVTANPGFVSSPSLPQLDEELRGKDPEGFMRTAYDDFIA